MRSFNIKVWILCIGMCKMIFASEDFEVVAPPLTQPTRLEYLADTYRFAGEGQLLEIGEGARGKFFVFDQTIFYPKGGGQPSDLGTITFANGVEYPVHLVLFDGSTGRVQHYVEGEVDTGLIGLGAAFKIDQARRSENAKAHSAGHLLDNVVSEVAPELIGKIGSHDAKEGCYVKFQGLLTSKKPDELLPLVNEQLVAIITEGREMTARLADPSELADLRLPIGYQLPAGKPCRIVQISGLPPSPCGGTHVDSLARFNKIQATKVKLEKKDNVTKISYVFE